MRASSLIRNNSNPELLFTLSASNDVEGYEYNLSGYFSDYYNTWTGQSPDSGSYSDSYPSSNSYASTVTENGFSFTWNGWDVQTRQGVYIHNTPYSGIWDIPFGLGSWSNPVEQPNSAWSSEPETPEPYSSPSQRYVDDLDDFFYGYDNSDLYEQGTQSENGITITTPSNQPISYANYGSSGLALVSAPPTSGEGEALFGSDYSSSDTFDDVWNILQEILHSASDDIIVPLSDAQFASLSTLLQNSREQAQAESDPPPQLANNPWTFMDSVHLVLDGIGLFPVIGDSADGVNAVLYWHEGNYTDAALSAASMIPLAGSSVTAAKWGKKGCEAAQTASKLADATKRGERITDIITEAAELERDSSKAAKAFKWTAASIHDPRFRDGCEGFAQRIHESIGGKIVRIEALPNRLGNPSPLPQYRGGNNKWFYHEVVVKDGKVYDAFTNSSGETIEQFKKHWNDQYRIIIWPF